MISTCKNGKQKAVRMVFARSIVKQFIQGLPDEALHSASLVLSMQANAQGPGRREQDKDLIDLKGIVDLELLHRIRTSNGTLEQTG